MILKTNTDVSLTILPKLLINGTKSFQEYNNNNNFNVTLNNEEKMKGSFLYQIMTDPKFIENLQKNKKKKKSTCQFCKKEFETEAEMRDHLNVRLDESNRVTIYFLFRI